MCFYIIPQIPLNLICVSQDSHLQLYILSHSLLKLSVTSLPPSNSSLKNVLLSPPRKALYPLSMSFPLHLTSPDLRIVCWLPFISLFFHFHQLFYLFIFQILSPFPVCHPEPSYLFPLPCLYLGTPLPTHSQCPSIPQSWVIEPP